MSKKRRAKARCDNGRSKVNRRLKKTAAAPRQGRGRGAAAAAREWLDAILTRGTWTAGDDNGRRRRRR